MSQVEVSKFVGGAVYESGWDSACVASKLIGGVVIQATEPVEVSKFIAGVIFEPLPVISVLDIDLRMPTLRIRL